MDKNKSAASYARVSTEEQTMGFSLESQVEQLKNYLYSKGYSDSNIEVFVDDGYSGKNFDRPNIQRLISNLNNFDVIAVWKVDRLSRNNEQVLSLFNNYLDPDNKKLLVSTCDIDSSTPNGHMFISLLGTFAEYERTQIIERVSSGMQKRAEKGKWNGGRILGYNNVDGALVINEHESGIVKEIFEFRALGHGYKSIVNHINTKGYRTKKGNPFGINSVKTILENPTYAGFIRWGLHKNWSEKRRSGRQQEVTLIPGKHEAIIDSTLWRRINEINEEQKKYARTTSNFKGEFILSGILKCPQCGKGMVMSKTKKPDNSYYLYYQCQNFHQRGLTACKSNLVPKEEIERKVLKKVKRLVISPDIVEGIYNSIKEDQSAEIRYYNNEIKLMEKELRKTLEEESGLLRRARLAIKENKEEEEKNYNLMLFQTVKEREELEKRIEEHRIFVKNNSSTISLNKELIMASL